MLLKDFINKYEKKFKEKDISSFSGDIHYIIEECLNIKKNDSIFLKEITINLEQRRKLESLFAKRLDRVPVQRIFQKAYFRNLELKLNNSNFIPRFDSEIIIDILEKKKLRPKKILELGTGSGAIIISVLKFFNHARGLASDISYESINMAKKNAIINKVDDRLNFICCNWLKVFVNTDFDLIISNPPYIETKVIKSLDPEVKFHDPLISLDGGEDGLTAYKRILSEIKFISNKPVIILFEIGYNQASRVRELMKKEGLKNIEIFNDYNNNNRFILGKKE